MNLSPLPWSWSEGWQVEVVDLRSIKPLDTDTVMGSVARTEDCSVSVKRGRGAADGKISRGAKATICSDARRNGSTPRDTPVPYHPNLWSRIARPRAASLTPPEKFCNVDLRLCRSSHHHAAAR